MANSISANYVKFVRGTDAAFKALRPEQINKDTLYFIMPDASADNGVLYLGDKIIGGGGKGGPIALKDLTDVLINTVKDNQVLIYDALTKKWVPRDISKAITIKVMTGASLDENGASGLVPAPKSGEQDKFLKGDGTWSKISAPSLNLDKKIFESSSIGELTLKNYNLAPVNSTLFKKDTGIEWVQTYSKKEIDNLLSGVSGKLIRKIVKSIEDIDIEAPDAFNYIYLVPKSSSSSGDLYDEYIVVEDESGQRKLEKISVGSGTIDLSNYVTTDTFNGFQAVVNKHIEDYRYFANRVGDPDNLLYTNQENASIVDQVNYLSERLTWQELK